MESPMSIVKKVFTGASWLAGFNIISQIFSWSITIVVARILVPADYGLMEVSTILTGYAAMFSELGLGSAIIQRRNSAPNEISSVFWFSFLISLLFALFCFPLSYFTAQIFKEPRVIYLTQAVALVFIFSGLQIVPFNLLKKELRFKAVGIIQMCGVIVSCVLMLILAHMGAGVWTLMIGMIVRSFVQMVLSYGMVKWRPRFYFNMKEATPYIKFGVATAISRSMFYVYDKSDRFFAGRIWSAKILGYYSLALQLAKLPTEKITVVINQVSYPAFSKLQDDPDAFNKFYLNIVKITMTMVLPLFVGGFLVSRELIEVLLGHKWMPIIFVFQYLCLTQVLTSLNAVNSFVHNAQGRPKWSMIYHGICAVFMPVSFYVAVQYGLNAMVVPWFTTYVFLCFGWIFVTIKKINIGLGSYISNIRHQLFATVAMIVPVLGVEYLLQSWQIQWHKDLLSLGLKLTSASLVYFSCLYLFDRKLLKNIKSILRK